MQTPSYLRTSRHEIFCWATGDFPLFSPSLSSASIHPPTPSSRQRGTRHSHSHMGVQFLHRISEKKVFRFWEMIWSQLFWTNFEIALYPCQLPPKSPFLFHFHRTYNRLSRKTRRLKRERKGTINWLSLRDNEMGVWMEREGEWPCNTTTATAIVQQQKTEHSVYTLAGKRVVGWEGFFSGLASSSFSSWAVSLPKITEESSQGGKSQKVEGEESRRGEVFDSFARLVYEFPFDFLSTVFLC